MDKGQLKVQIANLTTQHEGFVKAETEAYEGRLRCDGALQMARFLLAQEEAKEAKALNDAALATAQMVAAQDGQKATYAAQPMHEGKPVF